MDALMRAAIEEAEEGAREGGIPIGSVLVHEGRILGRGHNRRVQRGSVILHGEMDALEKAGRQPGTIYRASTLYTTLSPCPMCTGAILLYGIPRVVIGENRTFMGEEGLLALRGVRGDGMRIARLPSREMRGILPAGFRRLRRGSRPREEEVVRA